MMSATQRSGLRALAGTGIPGYFAMPTGVALTMPVADAAASDVVRPTRGAAERSREARREVVRLAADQGRRSRSRRSKLAQRMRHRPPRAASAKQQTASGPRLASPSGSSRQSPSNPCCVRRRPPAKTIVLTAPIARIRGKGVETADDALLERVGHVEAGQAEARSGPDHRRQVAILERAAVEVDQAVGVGDSDARPFGHVHMRRFDYADSAADERRTNPRSGRAGEGPSKDEVDMPARPRCRVSHLPQRLVSKSGEGYAPGSNRSDNSARPARAGLDLGATCEKAASRRFLANRVITARWAHVVSPLSFLRRLACRRPGRSNRHFPFGFWRGMISR